MKKQREMPKLLLAIGAGFGEYSEQLVRIAIQSSSKKTGGTKEQIKQILESFGEKSVQYLS